MPTYGDYRKKVGKMKRNDNSPFVPVTIAVPRVMLKRIKKIAIEKEKSVSRLFCFGIDNEFDAEDPFHYNTELIGDTPYVQNAFADEAGKLFHYIKSIDGGISLESLMLCREEIPLKDRRKLAFAFRELLETGMIFLRQHRDTKEMRAHPYSVTPKDFKRGKRVQVEDEH